MCVLWIAQTVAHIYLIHLPVVVVSQAFRIRHDNNTLGQPIIWLFLGAFLASNSQLALKLFYETILRVAFVVNYRAHLPANDAIPIHGMDVGCLLCTSDHRLDLSQG